MTTCKPLALALALSLFYPARAVPPSGLSPACGRAYEAIGVCRQKVFASDLPASMKQSFDQRYAEQMAHAVQTWRSMRGVAEIESSCKEIAQNPGCDIQ